ncbi:histidinol-phosphate transaminase [Fredinandcohnia quinoae]|uniref:Histidinol-phosphate aminotransferase n=1 Tax=Fredinandcohnia quinoae TaxID=2918902 RepID=A0AAW5E6F3_9BACI|nr:histidinol-phosphate transaminase [Fredinandcohnia sp. SECRCQ15]MCH1627943.1 histidinol-phosphate transaminase [Fredinandcohnia sp. SECRCQ15]
MKINTRKEIEEVRPYNLGKSPEDIKNEYGLQVIQKMSDNENVYGCTTDVEKELTHSIKQLHSYPDGITTVLTENLASFYQLNQNQFLIGNGSEEIIRLLTRGYISSGDEVIIADPTFPRYEANAIIEGGILVKVPLRDGKHDLRAMVEAISIRTKMIFVCNPNNPTGTIVGKDELFQFIKTIPNHIIVVIDEAYFEYVMTDDYLKTHTLLDRFANLVILRTFSKVYGLAALRVGYGMMSPDFVQQLMKVKDVFNVNQLAQNAARVALNDQHFVKECAKKNQLEREFVTRKLIEMDYKVYPSETNFLYACSEHPVAEKLQKKGMLVRAFSQPNGGEAIRVTLGTREENIAFLHVIGMLKKERVV